MTGRSLIGSCWYAIMPTTRIPTRRSVVVTGRLMKREERFMGLFSPCAHLFRRLPFDGNGAQLYRRVGLQHEHVVALLSVLDGRRGHDDRVGFDFQCQR